LEEFEATSKKVSISLGFFFGGKVPEDSPLVTDIIKWNDKLFDLEFDHIEEDEEFLNSSLVKRILIFLYLTHFLFY